MAEETITMGVIAANILLWHYFSEEDHPMSDSKSKYEAIKSLKQNDLLKVTDDYGYPQITKRGITLVKYWLETPLPESKTIWVIGRND